MLDVVVWLVTVASLVAVAGSLVQAAARSARERQQMIEFTARVTAKAEAARRARTATPSGPFGRWTLQPLVHQYRGCDEVAQIHVPERVEPVATILRCRHTGERHPVNLLITGEHVADICGTCGEQVEPR